MALRWSGYALHGVISSAQLQSNQHTPSRVEGRNAPAKDPMQCVNVWVSFISTKIQPLMDCRGLQGGD